MSSKSNSLIIRDRSVSSELIVYYLQRSTKGHRIFWFSVTAGGRLLARRASMRPGTSLEREMDAFGRPNSGGKGKLFSTISLSILIYLKRNSFNSHYYYTFDILINLIVYLAE